LVLTPVLLAFPAPEELAVAEHVRPLHYLEANTWDKLAVADSDISIDERDARI
jgi:hypothetical protein